MFRISKFSKKKSPDKREFQPPLYYITHSTIPGKKFQPETPIFAGSDSMSAWRQKLIHSSQNNYPEEIILGENSCLKFEKWASSKNGQVSSKNGQASSKNGQVNLINNKIFVQFENPKYNKTHFRIKFMVSCRFFPWKGRWPVSISNWKYK